MHRLRRLQMGVPVRRPRFGGGRRENICPNGAIGPLPDHRRLLKVEIVPEKCIGCSLCARACPAGAPHGELKKPFEIDQGKCFQCGMCLTKCRKDAINAVYA